MLTIGGKYYIIFGGVSALPVPPDPPPIGTYYLLAPNGDRLCAPNGDFLEYPH